MRRDRARRPRGSARRGPRRPAWRPPRPRGSARSRAGTSRRRRACPPCRRPATTPSRARRSSAPRPRRAGTCGRRARARRCGSGAQTTTRSPRRSIARSIRRAVARLEVLHPLEHDRALLEGGDQRRLGHDLGAVDVADVHDHQRAPVGLRRERLRVGPGEDDRERARVAQDAGERLHRLVAAGIVDRPVDHAQPAGAGRVVHADAEQVRGEAVGELDRPLGERGLRVAGDADRAPARAAAPCARRRASRRRRSRRRR